MSWLINVVIGILAVALIVLIIVRVRIQRRLNSIDGVIGVTTRGGYDGKVIGGELTEGYRRKKP